MPVMPRYHLGTIDLSKPNFIMIVTKIMPSMAKKEDLREDLRKQKTKQNKT